MGVSMPTIHKFLTDVQRFIGPLSGGGRPASFTPAPERLPFGFPCRSARHARAASNRANGMCGSVPRGPVYRC